MSQVLKYGVPQSDNLRCDNPACSELANYSIRFAGASNEVFACAEHLPGMRVTQGGEVKRLVKLTVPGSHNKEQEVGKESKEAEKGG
jgi:hypothetical protein